MIVVAGHLCLDVIPAMTSGVALEPGSLVEVGEASFSSGGAVANVGLALAKLGAAPVLAGRVGDDPFGAILRTCLEAGLDEGDTDRLLAGIVAAGGETTSYSIVISPRGQDRIFLHHSGCNDAFSPTDLQRDRFRGARLLHFGYPPLMRRVFEDGGAALHRAFARLRDAGIATSLDMAHPDPQGASGRVDWRAFLELVLPEVDLFLPSWKEICFMLEPAAEPPPPNPEAVARTAEELLALGPALVGLKLGDEGFYVRTAAAERCASVAAAGLPNGWSGRELWSPNFRVDVQGTTGAGDATIAGLLAALDRSESLEAALTLASAAGASAVEGLDAVGAVLSSDALRDRIAAGWERAVTPADTWPQASGSGVLTGPNDRAGPPGRT